MFCDLMYTVVGVMHSVAHCPGAAFWLKEPSLESNQIIPSETAAKPLS